MNMHENVQLQGGILDGLVTIVPINALVTIVPINTPGYEKASGYYTWYRYNRTSKKDSENRPIFEYDDEYFTNGVKVE